MKSKKSILRSERDLMAAKIASISFSFLSCTGTTSIKPLPWFTYKGTLFKTASSSSDEDEFQDEVVRIAFLGYLDWPIRLTT